MPFAALCRPALYRTEDIEICQRVQIGTAAPTYQGGRFSYRFEETLHRFQNMLVDKMTAGKHKYSWLGLDFDCFDAYFPAPDCGVPCAVPCSSRCQRVSDADRCVQSNAVPNSRVLTRALIHVFRYRIPDGDAGTYRGL